MGGPPDPQAEETFLRSKLNLELSHKDRHRTLHSFYQELLRLRREVAALAFLSKEQMSVVTDEEAKVLFVRRWHDNDEVILALCFSETGVAVKLPVPAGRWSKLLDSADAVWDGPGTALAGQIDSTGGLEVALKPRSAVLYRRCMEA